MWTRNLNNHFKHYTIDTFISYGALMQKHLFYPKTLYIWSTWVEKFYLNLSLMAMKCIHRLSLRFRFVCNTRYLPQYLYCSKRHRLAQGIVLERSIHCLSISFCSISIFRTQGIHYFQYCNFADSIKKGTWNL